MLTGYGRTLPLSSCDFAFFSIDSSQQGLSARWLTAPAYLLQGWGLEQKEVLSPSGSSVHSQGSAFGRAQTWTRQVDEVHWPELGHVCIPDAGGNK